MKHEVVALFWNDAVASVGWETEYKSQPLECITVGKIVYEDERSITVASTWGEFDEDHNCRMTIPATWIKKRKVLKV